MYLYLLFILGIFLLSIYYFITRIYKFEFIKDKFKNKKWIFLLILCLLLIILLISFKLTLIIFFLHLVLFLLIGDIIYLFGTKIIKKQIKYSCIFFLMLIITTVYLGYAYFNAGNIRETKYIVETSKNVGEVNLLYISDTHIGSTFNGKTFAEYLKKISTNNIDILLVGGDFVDEHTSYEDMVDACNALGNFKTKYGVYMIFGNHDLDTYGGNNNYTSSAFISELANNNVKILQDKVVLVDERFYIIGRKDKSVINRASVDMLVRELDKEKVIIVVDHQPVDYENNKKFGVDLVLSGHTHGGQMFPLAYIGEYVSSNEMTYGIKKDKTTYVVSSGMSGWGIPFKTGTISEYVNIKIQ